MRETIKTIPLLLKRENSAIRQITQRKRLTPRPNGLVCAQTLKNLGHKKSERRIMEIKPSPLAYLLLRLFFIVVASFVFSASVFAETEAEKQKVIERYRGQAQKALEPFMKEGVKFHDSFYAKIKEDLTWKMDKHIEQLEIMKKMLLQSHGWIAKEIERCEPLADEVYAKAMDYQDRLTFLCLQGSYYCEQATITMWDIAEGALEMRIGIAEGFLKVNETKKAKEVYRNIIATFTQPRFSSYIKKAEFALEDIKEIEAKTETEAKPKKTKKK